ncbi:MAG: hypothetical protein JSS32_10055 [Verrucomicrobia bacterium]|nr:hypothetical protein [Verrucomicrobiota bacterium]
MQPRIERYKNFIESQFIDSLLWNQDFSMDHLSEKLKRKISAGQFKKIIFTGMGCSAIVSDVIKGFFADQQIPIYVDVVNDYDFDVLVDKNDLMDEKTLIIVSSYSGHSQEPIHFYHRVKTLTKNIIFLTSGGQLAEIGRQDDISVIYWKLRNPDREYPLFHVPQYFCILLELFFQLKILKTNYQSELVQTKEFLRGEFTEEKIGSAEKIAERLRDREIVFIAPPKWYVSLLKLADMHFNEMAMVPAHRNYFHEFTHSEVAVFSDPPRPLAIVLFRDSDNDPYIQAKMDRFIQLMTDKKVRQNMNITLVELKLDQGNFLNKFFSTLLYLNYVAYFLGVYSDVKSRELISTAAGNPWYNQSTIQKEQVCTTKPSHSLAGAI